MALVAGCGGGQPTAVGARPIHIGHLQNVVGGPGQPEGIWGAPPGGQTPRGVLLLIHGGSWKGNDVSSFKSMLATAPVFQSLGLETFTVNYRGGAQGINDVENLYLQARRQVGSAVPICAAGVSAGGHIALMLAVRFHDLACVLDLAGPTDLSLLKRGSTAASQIVERAFGTASLAQLSPALQAHSIRAKLLLLYAQSDRLVPVDQGYAMERADPNAQLIVLPPGSAAFVHTGILGPVQDTGVDPGAYAKAQKTEAAFLDHATATG